MIVDWKILLLTLPLAVSLLLCCYATGIFLSWLVQLFDKKKLPGSTRQSSLFWTLTSGLVFLTGVYAAIITNFQTSLLPIPILAIALIRLETVSTVPTNSMAPSLKSSCFYLVAGLVFYWLLFAIYFFFPEPGRSFYSNPDSLFYARAADHLNNGGVENVTIDYLGIYGSFVEPYHYGDLWITAFVQKLSSLPPALISPLIVYPSLAVIFISGLDQYLRAAGIRKAGFFSYSVVILSGLVSGFVFQFPRFLIPGSLNLSVPIIFLPKLFLVAIIIIGLALALKKNSWNQALLIASSGSLLFINIAPAILISLALIGIFAFLKRNRTGYSIGPAYFILSLLALVYYFLFYKINTSSGFDPGGISFSFQTFINIIAAGCLQIIPIIPFVILLFLWRNKKNDRDLKKINPSYDILFLFTVPFAGLFSWGVLYGLTAEAVQFFSNVLVPVAAIAIVYLVMMVLKKNVKQLSVLAILALTLTIFLYFKSSWFHKSVRTHDIELVSGFLKKYQPGNFVNLRASGEFNNWLSRQTMFVQPLPFITYLHPAYYNISLNTPSIVIDSSRAYSQYEKNMLAYTPFSLYIKKRNESSSMEEYAYLFITEYKIPYLAVSPDTTIPVRLRSLIKDSLLLSDNWYIYYLEK